MRRIRGLVWTRLKLLPAIVEPNNYLVAQKAAGFATKPTWSTLCSDVRVPLDQLYSKNSKTYRLTCSEPHKISFRQSVHLAMKNSVFISEHGTVSYNVLFAQDITCAIIIGGNYKKHYVTKEWHVLLYLTHIHVFYIHTQNRSELSNLLGHCYQKINQASQSNFLHINRL